MNNFNYKLLITGYKGYIGSYFCRYLKKNKIKFRKFNFNNYPNNLNSFSHFFHFDFEIKTKKGAEKRNLSKIRKVLNICKNNDIKLIFPSTVSYKYNNKGKRISKNIYPINKYTSSKIDCEREILNFSKKNNLKYFIFRIFNVYGGNLKNRWVVATFIKKIKNNNIIKIHYSKNTRDFINIDDVCNLFKKSLRKNISGIFEVGTGKSTSIKYLALTLKKLINKKAKFIFPEPTKSKTNFYSKAKLKMTKKIFLWRPKINLINGLRILVCS